jgi:hypothetical protein
MVSAMMKQTTLNATLMVETAVDYVYLKTIVQTASALKMLLSINFLMLLLVMAIAMIEQII